MSDEHQHLEPAKKVVDLGIKASDAYGRDDLADRLRQVRRNLDDPAFHVVVAGEFKQGKSSLVNALLNAPICPVDDDIATALPTFVRHGAEPGAELVVRVGDSGTEVERRPLAMAEVPAVVTDDHDDDDVLHAEIRLPRKLLASGMVLVDTPGVGGLGSRHGAVTLGALPYADAVVFVSDASQELTQSELDFLKKAIEYCPRVVFALTKVDFYPAWRKIADLNRGHLGRAGLDLEIVPLSASLRQVAVETSDRDLNEESGYLRLVSFLNEEVARRRGDELVRQAAGEVRSVATQIRGQFASEREALADPEAAARAVTELEAAKERTEALRGRMARWQTTLSDGSQDLTANVDHDLRLRIRTISQEADAAIDDNDPADIWDEFEPWLYRRTSGEMMNTHAVLHQGIAELVDRVADHFAEDSEALVERLTREPVEAGIAQVRVTAGLEIETENVAVKGLTAMRGSYSGILMFGMMGGMLGLGAIVTPVGLVMGLVLGRKGLKDEKKRQVVARRAQAKNTVRKYTDEVAFHVTKEVRDVLRQVQRDLRDHYTARAEELNRSATESLAAAQQAAQADQSQRQQRLRDIEAELGRLDDLVGRAERLVPAGEPS